MLVTVYPKLCFVWCLDQNWRWSDTASDHSETRDMTRMLESTIIASEREVLMPKMIPSCFVWFAEVNADKTIRRQSRLLPGYAEQTQMLGSLMSDVTVTRPWSVSGPVSQSEARSGPVSQSEGGRGRVTQARIWLSARTGAQECSAHCERIGGEEILELEPHFFQS